MQVTDGGDIVGKAVRSVCCLLIHIFFYAKTKVCFGKYLVHWSYVSNDILQAYHCTIQCVRMHTALHNCNVQMALLLTVTSWWSPCLYFVYSTGVSELRIRSSAPINLVVLVITCRYFITGQTDCRVVITASRCCPFLPGNKHMSACDMSCSPTVWPEFGNSVVTSAPTGSAHVGLNAKGTLMHLQHRISGKFALCWRISLAHFLFHVHKSASA